MRLLRDMGTVSDLLLAAEDEARRMGDEIPGAEHLVLAALASEDGSARALLEVDADRFRQAVQAVHSISLDSLGVAPEAIPTRSAAKNTGVYRSEDSVREVMEGARLLARKTRPRGLRAAHVVQAAAEREFGTVARALTELGIDRERLKVGDST